jgi:hypothetical protein
MSGDSNPGIQPQGATNNGNLFIPNKQTMGTYVASKYGIDMRAIERWCNSLIARIASGIYASLTGPGETTTPGTLSQAGALQVTQPSGGTARIELIDNGSGGILIEGNAPGFGVQITSTDIVALTSGGSSIEILDATGDIELHLAVASSFTLNLPTSPGASGTWWNDAGTVKIV